MHACTCMYAHTLCPSHTLVHLASCQTCVYAHTPLLPRFRPPLRRSRPPPRLLCHRPTRAPMHSRTFTHTCAAQPTASHPPLHTLATHPHPVPPRPSPTLAMPSPSTNMCKRTCIHHLWHALPPSSNLALMPNLVLHARDHEYARTHILAPMSHPTRMHPPGAARTHGSPAFLFCFPVILFL